MFRTYSAFVFLFAIMPSILVQTIEIESDSIAGLFRKMDTNQDGALSKKEFYYALMEDEFESLSSKHSVPSLELEFENQDENHDKRITLEEWELIFFPRNSKSKSQPSDFVTSDIGKSEQVVESVI
jgi:Ca2+-binding EF-hand superfamily protein